MINEALLSIGLLIVVAKLAEGIFRRFGLNSIVAYAVTGLILGPVTGFVEPTSDLQLVLGIGVFVFFFLIGLDEIDISGFVAAIRGRFFVAATVSVVISLVAALTVTSDLLYDFGLGLEFDKALALAGILSLSSLGIVAKVLADEGRLKDPLGLQLFTTVIIAELLALLVVGFTIGEHAEKLSVIVVLTLLGKITGFTVATWFLSTRVIPHLLTFLQRVLQVPHLSFGLLLGGLFLMVVGAEEIGLHGSIGALLFGAALSGLPHQVRQSVLPGIRSAAEGLFVPLFFASAGLHLSLSFTNLPPWTIVALVTIPLAGKFAGAFIGAYVTRLDISFPLAAGLLAKGVAEVALLLVLFQTDVIGEDVFSLLVLNHARLHPIHAPGYQLCHQSGQDVGQQRPAPDDPAFPRPLHPRRRHGAGHPRQIVELPGVDALCATLRRPLDRAAPTGLRGRREGRPRGDRVAEQAAVPPQE